MRIPYFFLLFNPFSQPLISTVRRSTAFKVSPCRTRGSCDSCSLLIRAVRQNHHHHQACTASHTVEHSSSISVRCSSTTYQELDDNDDDDDDEESNNTPFIPLLVEGGGGGRGASGGGGDNDNDNAVAFGRRQRGTPIWTDPGNHRKFFDWVASKLGIRKHEDWYQVSREDVIKLGGAGLLVSHYGNSLPKALQLVYPEFEWVPWNFANGVRKRYWKDIANHKRFFEFAARRLNIRKPEDWYSVTMNDIARLGGLTLLSKCYASTLSKALSTLYPEVDWVPWKFATGVPKGFWREAENHRQFFDWAAQELNVRKHEDWYQVTREDICRIGGKGLLANYYGNSLPHALAAVYPALPWQHWRFRSFIISESYYINESELRDYVAYLAQELRIQTLDDWYRVSVKQIRQLGGYSIIKHQGGLFAVLKSLHPEHPWDEQRFHTSRGKKASQRLLRVAMQRLLPNEEIMEEYEHPNILRATTENQLNNESNNNNSSSSSSSSTNRTAVILDLWIPSLSLALEYHGEQHFRDVHFFGDSQKQRERDEEKIALCNKAGVTLVIVPYWWDGSVESVAAAILESRPDLAPVISLEAAAQEKIDKVKPNP